MTGGIRPAALTTLHCAELIVDDESATWTKLDDVVIGNRIGIEEGRAVEAAGGAGLEGAINFHCSAAERRGGCAGVESDRRALADGRST